MNHRQLTHPRINEELFLITQLAVYIAYIPGIVRTFVWGLHIQSLPPIQRTSYNFSVKRIDCETLFFFLSASGQNSYQTCHQTTQIQYRSTRAIQKSLNFQWHFGRFHSPVCAKMTIAQFIRTICAKCKDYFPTFAPFIDNL